jgi:hypothetical protein
MTSLIFVVTHDKLKGRMQLKYLKQMNLLYSHFKRAISPDIELPLPSAIDFVKML